MNIAEANRDISTSLQAKAWIKRTECIQAVEGVEKKIDISRYQYLGLL